MHQVDHLFLLAADEVAELGVRAIGIIETCVLVIETVYIESVETRVEAGLHAWCENEIAGGGTVIAERSIAGRNAEVVEVEIPQRRIYHKIRRLTQVAVTQGKRIGHVVVLRGIPLHGATAHTTRYREAVSIELCLCGGADAYQRYKKDDELPHSIDS